MTPPLFLLASTSPRRRDLLQSLGLAFDVVANPWDEVAHPGESPRRQVRRLAREKLEFFITNHPSNHIPVLTADTLIGFKGRALGKPTSEAEALQGYRRLAGHSHTVLTCVCLWVPGRRRPITKLVSTRVTWHAWNDELYDAYLRTGEWRDAAGGYRIQETGGRLVDHIEGSWSNVVGLPLAEVYGMIRRYLFLDRP